MSFTFVWGTMVKSIKYMTAASQAPCVVNQLSPRHHIKPEMSNTKVPWLLCIGRLVSKTDSVMSFAHLVKQASVDLVLDLFVYYRLECELFVCSWGFQIYKTYSLHPTWNPVVVSTGNVVTAVSGYGQEITFIHILTAPPSSPQVPRVIQASG